MGGMMPPRPAMPPMMSGVPPGNVSLGYAFKNSTPSIPSALLKIHVLYAESI